MGLATGVLLVALLPGGNRVDPRLVGKWTSAGSPPLNISETFTLRADGTSLEEQMINVGPAPMKSAIPQFWSVEGDELRFRSEDPRSVWARAVRAYFGIRAFLLRVSLQTPAQDTWEVVEVTDDTLRLKYTGGRRWPQPEYELIRVVPQG